jgi:hypothetical protein
MDASMAIKSPSLVSDDIVTSMHTTQNRQEAEDHENTASRERRNEGPNGGFTMADGTV